MITDTIKLNYYTTLRKLYLINWSKLITGGNSEKDITRIAGVNIVFGVLMITLILTGVE